MTATPEISGSSGAKVASPRSSRRDLAFAFALGMLGAMFFWALYRIIHIKFPINFFNPILMVWALTGIPLGLLSRQEHPTLTPLRQGAFAAGLIALGVCVFQFKDISIHYLLFDVYYVYPSPEGSHPVLGLLGVVLLSPLYFAWLVRHIPRGDRWPRDVAVATAVGVALGLVAGHYLLLLVGGYALFAAALPCALMWMRPRVMALSLAALSVLISGVLFYGEEAYFMWQIKDYKRIDKSIWTTNYKIDSVEFAEGRCYAPILNSIVIALSCSDPTLAPTTSRRFTDALANRTDASNQLLEIGRSTGFAVSAYERRRGDLVLLEGDPQIAADAKGRFAHYSGDIFNHAYDVQVGERRWMLEDLVSRHRGPPFDTAFITSVGNMLVLYPMTFIAQENYLFTEEALKLVFDEFLGSEGVLVMDRGSPVVEDIYFMAASLPLDVHVRVLWTKMIDFPYMGLPLFFVLASRDEARLDYIVSEATQATDVFTHVPIDMAQVRTSSFDDDRPFMQEGLAWGLAVMVLPLLYGLRRWLRRVMRRRDPETLPVGGRLDLLVGVLAGMIFLWFSAKGGRAHITGVNTGFIWCAGGFWLGVSLALGLPWWRARVRRVWALVAAGLLALAAAAILNYPFVFSVALGANVLAGCALAIFHAAVPSPPSGLPQGWLRALGVLMGLLVFQLVVRASGFVATAVLLAASMAAVSLWTARVDRKAVGSDGASA